MSSTSHAQLIFSQMITHERSRVRNQSTDPGTQGSYMCRPLYTNVSAVLRIFRLCDGQSMEGCYLGAAFVVCYYHATIALLLSLGFAVGAYFCCCHFTSLVPPFGRQMEQTTEKPRVLNRTRKIRTENKAVEIKLDD